MQIPVCLCVCVLVTARPMTDLSRNHGLFCYFPLVSLTFMKQMHQVQTSSARIGHVFPSLHSTDFVRKRIASKIWLAFCHTTVTLTHIIFLLQSVLN